MARHGPWAPYSARRRLLRALADRIHWRPGTFRADASDVGASVFRVGDVRAARVAALCSVASPSDVTRRPGSHSARICVTLSRGD